MSRTYDLKGKAAIVTGGASGLGKDIALTLGKAGVSIVVADINIDGGRKVVNEIEKLPQKAMFIEVDVTDSNSVNEMCRWVVEKFGAIDILVNSAGITKRLPALDFPEEDFDQVINVNLKGTFLCCQAVGREMVKSGGGKIVNLASIGGMVGLKNTVAYCASKGGVVQMTRALAIDWAQYKINVNAVAPSLANTPIAKSIFKDKKTLEWFLSGVPMGRLCEPKDVSAAVLFLASPEADFITGHILAVDGGYLAK